MDLSRRNEALSYQVKANFDKSENLEPGTATAINYSACYGQYIFINRYFLL
jgi:hypothetical protein